MKKSGFTALCLSLVVVLMVLMVLVVRRVALLLAFLWTRPA